MASDWGSVDGNFVYCFRDNPIEPEYWIPDSHPHAFILMNSDPDIILVEDWCQDYIGDNGAAWFSDGSTIFIRRCEDATAFKLRWF